MYGKTGTAEVPTAHLLDLLQRRLVVGLGDERPAGRSCVVAMIQDGGHGGVAAAPAALRVFEAFFHSG